MTGRDSARKGLCRGRWGPFGSCSPGWGRRCSPGRTSETLGNRGSHSDWPCSRSPTRSVRSRARTSTRPFRSASLPRGAWRSPNLLVVRRRGSSPGALLGTAAVVLIARGAPIFVCDGEQRRGQRPSACILRGGYDSRELFPRRVSAHLLLRARRSRVDLPTGRPRSSRAWRSGCASPRLHLVGNPRDEHVGESGALDGPCALCRGDGRSPSCGSSGSLRFSAAPSRA